ncbi:MAG: hypothetical protein ACM3MJ_06700, partial [Deltaproteobacteria bacterium]
THIVPDAAAEGAAERKPAARKPPNAPPAKKTAAPKAPAKKPRQASRRGPGADVIDITTARRRAAAE